MLKHLILCLLFLEIFAACKKSNSSSPSPYYIKCAINDTATTFNYMAKATRDTDYYGAISITISGLVSVTPGTPSLTVRIIDLFGPTHPITAGTYLDTAQNMQVNAIYTDGVTGSTYIGGNGVSSFNGTGVIPFSLVIGSIDSVSIKGTFSGATFLDGGSLSTKKALTNGDFYVRFQ